MLQKQARSLVRLPARFQIEKRISKCYVVDSSCSFLRLGTRFWAVFGTYCSQPVLRFFRSPCLDSLWNLHKVWAEKETVSQRFVGRLRNHNLRTIRTAEWQAVPESEQLRLGER